MLSSKKRVIFIIGVIFLLICAFLIFFCAYANSNAADSDSMFSESSKVLNNGIYIPLTGKSNIYFVVNENSIMMNGSKQELKELFKTSNKLIDNNETDIDKLADAVIADWTMPKNYTLIDIIISKSRTDTCIALNIEYGKNEDIISCSGMDYISDNTFSYLGIIFILKQ